MTTKNHNAVVRKRAAKAAKIIYEAYDKHDPETSVMDCLADIGHLCAVRGWNFYELLDRAQAHEKCERLGLD